VFVFKEVNVSLAKKMRALADHIVVRERDGHAEYLCAFDPEEPDHWSWSRNRFHAIKLIEDRARWYAEVVGGEPKPLT
jgi:hypothetical protein